MKKIILSSMLVLSLFTFAMGKQTQQVTRILLYSKCPLYRHEVIPEGIKMIKKLASSNNWDLTVTEDSSLFSESRLNNTDVVIFFYTNGDILNNVQQKLIERFVESGKSLLTIHSGTSTENDWGWLVNAIGAKFVGHPPTQKATVIIDDAKHQSVSMFPCPEWEVSDEWFSFDRNPRDKMEVLASVDESTYNVDDNSMFKGAIQRMGDHPIIWYKRVGKGIVYQSSLGHTKEMIDSSLYQQHIAETINWLSGK